MKRTTIKLYDGTTIIKAESVPGGFIWAAVQHGDKTAPITEQDFRDLTEMDQRYRKVNGMAPAGEEVVETVRGGQ